MAERAVRVFGYTLEDYITADKVYELRTKKSFDSLSAVRQYISSNMNPSDFEGIISLALDINASEGIKNNIQLIKQFEHMLNRRKMSV